MAANTDRSRLKSGILILGLTGLILQGCAGGAVTGTVYALSGAAAAKLHSERQQFRAELSKDYSRYETLFSGSGCTPQEYEVSPVIMDYLRKSAPTEDGYAEAQDILMKIYRDPTLSEHVRAHALYLAALGEFQKEEGSRDQAREYLRDLKKEFPGTHDCAVETLLRDGHKIQ